MREMANERHDSNTKGIIKDDESANNDREREDLKSFAQDTTLHGARFLFAKNIFRRLLWILALIACFSYCSYQVFTSVKAFRDWPFNTKISTNASKENKELSFPAVTLCNINAMNTRRYKNFFKGRIPESLIERKIKDISLLATKSNKIFNPEFIQRNKELFRRTQTVSSTLDTQSNLSHQINEMLLPSSSQFNSCSINGIRCNAMNFTHLRSPVFGQCYTFNSAKSGHPLLHATLAGQNSGLKLLLNIERDSYTATIARPLVGLAIVVHDQKSFPFVDELGITIQPGISTLCAIKRRKVGRGNYYNIQSKITGC